MAPGGGLELVVSARDTETAGIDGVKRELLAVSVFLVNSRREALSRFGDVVFCFQARLQLDFAAGFEQLRRPRVLRCDGPRRAPRRPALPRRLLLRRRPQHAPAIGPHPTKKAASRPSSPTRCPRRTSRSSAPTLTFAGVERGDGGAGEAAEDVAALEAALAALPTAYAVWAKGQAALITGIQGVRRRETAQIASTTSSLPGSASRTASRG